MVDLQSGDDLLTFAADKDLAPVVALHEVHEGDNDALSDWLIIDSRAGVAEDMGIRHSNSISSNDVLVVVGSNVVACPVCSIVRWLRI